MLGVPVLISVVALYHLATSLNSPLTPVAI